MNVEQKEKRRGKNRDLFRRAKRKFKNALFLSKIFEKSKKSE